jgi:uncharacterized linocin/CFP29 family protein
MDTALATLGWTEDDWNRVCSSVSEEAQKARICAQILPSVGPEDRSTVAVPRYRLSASAVGADKAELTVNSDPDLYLTKIAVNVSLRSHEVGDRSLNAALLMFRRAANVIAHLEDSLVFYGRRSTSLGPPPSSTLNRVPSGLPQIYDITNDSHNVEGLYGWQVGPSLVGDPGPTLARNELLAPLELGPEFRSGQQALGRAAGDGVVNAIVSAINAIERGGYYGPFGCALSHDLFSAICTPTPSLVLPRDRILPFLQGPLLRSSVIEPGHGVVISLAGSPVELVVASDIQVKFLQLTPSGRALFRVSERVALRIKDPQAIQWIKE